MKYKELFVASILGGLLFAGCSTTQNETFSFESKAVAESVQAAVGESQANLTADMLTSLNLAQIANGEIFFASLSSSEEEHQIFLNRDETGSLPISMKTEEFGKSPTLYWEDAPMETLPVDLKGLERLPALESITLFAPNPDTLQQVAQLDTIRHLTLYLQADQILLLPDMSKMKQLETLDISGGTVQNAHYISGIKNLTQLNLTDGAQVDDWQFLSKLKQLEHLTLPSDFSDLSFVNGKNLKYLDLSQTSVTDFASMAEMNQLETLNITGLDIKDFSFADQIKTIIK